MQQMILRRVHLIKLDELFNKMRLVVKAVMCNDVLPVDVLAVGDLIRQNRETFDSRVILGRDADLLEKLFFEVSPADAKMRSHCIHRNASFGIVDVIDRFVYDGEVRFPGRNVSHQQILQNSDAMANIT